MSDFIYTNGYIALSQSFKHNRFNPLNGLTTQRRKMGLDYNIVDTFFALRGHHRPNLNNHYDAGGLHNFTNPIWKSTRGDKFGILDYLMLMLPAAVKAASALINLGLYQKVLVNDKLNNGLKALLFLPVIVPGFAIGLSLACLSWMLDQVKNLVALTSTAAFALLILLPLNIPNAIKDYKENKSKPMVDLSKDIHFSSSYSCNF